MRKLILLIWLPIMGLLFQWVPMRPFAAPVPQIMQKAIVFLPVPAVGGVTWTLIQHPHNWTCTSTASGNLTCTVTATATVAGDALLLALSYYDAITVDVAPTYVSAAGDSTWTHNAGCADYGLAVAGVYVGVDCAYILSATGGATSLSMTYDFFDVNATDGAFMDLELYEMRRSTGTPSLDVLGASFANSCSTTCTGPALSLTGTDYVAEWAATCNPPTVPGAPWTNPSDVDSSSNQIAGFLGALNQTSVTALTYSQSPSCGFGGGAFSFK